MKKRSFDIVQRLITSNNHKCTV